jgi:DNA-binding transcriptional regulator YiaG
MNPVRIRQLTDRKERIKRGEVAPAAVWEVKQNAAGGFTYRKRDPKRFQREQKKAWDRSIAATRLRLGLSQNGFAELLGISVRTLHHWEQGTRTPSRAARVLLKVAEKHPKVVLEAAA